MDTATVARSLTIVDAARHLRISRSKLYELLAAGEMPSEPIGRTRRITTSALEEFVADHTHREPAPSPA